MQLRFFLLLIPVFLGSTLMAQQYNGQGTLEINFLEGSKIVHTISTDQLVASYDADQELFRLLLKPAALSVGANAFDQSVVEEVLQSRANRLMMIQASDLVIPQNPATKQSMGGSYSISYQGLDVELPGVLSVTPATNGLGLELELTTSLEQLGLYLPEDFQESLSSNIQFRILNVNLTHR